MTEKVHFTDADAKKSLVAQHELRLRKAENARQSLQAEEQNTSQDTEACPFDLQKVFPLPSLTAGEAFYCRQLSAYNLGIHSLSNGKVVVNLWHEGIASRGPEEIASCLLLYCKQLAASGVRVITAYSDSCGGQNRNFKVALMWLNICQKYGFSEVTKSQNRNQYVTARTLQAVNVLPHIETTEQKFF